MSAMGSFADRQVLAPIKLNPDSPLSGLTWASSNVCNEGGKQTLRSAAPAAVALLGRLLDRWARDIAVRAINATVSLQRAELRRAVRAVIEKLAGIGGHRVCGAPAALWACEGGGKLHHAGPIALIIWASKCGRIAERVMKAVAVQSRMKVALVGGERVQDTSRLHSLRRRT